jgi:hypothetical protein
MTTRMNWKVVVLTGLLAAAIVGRSMNGAAIVMLLFGVFNTLVAVPGTLGPRAVGIVASAVALLHIADPRTIEVLVAWIWPAAFLVGWAVARSRATGSDDGEGGASGHRARNAVAVGIAAIAVAVIAFRGITAGGFQQTALLFFGLPALLAITVTLGVSPRSATGVACKAVTVGLLVSLIFLGEGFLCIAMSAPLFYAVAVGAVTAAERVRTGGRARRTVSGLMLMTFVPLSLEGVTPMASLDRDETVTVSNTIDVPFDQVSAALVAAPRFDRTLPAYLRLGFPRPIATQIDRRGSHPRWVIRLRGGETRFNGTEPKTGDLMLELDEARPGFLRWRVLADGSHMTHFLRWRESSVRWEPAGPMTTKVTWTLRYRRGLDPAWYFGPWERYAVGLAAQYLIDTVAMP